ncbi:MAG: hypothetical protein M0P13_12505, partial [Fibrobacteraceae bacterium]|nr:hypothetical protein [Fibrobacteraceae bacterium]
MVIQPGLLVLLLARIPIPLLAHLACAAACLVTRVAVGIVFFVADDVRVSIQLKAREVQIIVGLVTQNGRRRCDRASVLRGERLDDVALDDDLAHALSASVVGVSGGAAVAVLDAGAFSLGVVVDAPSPGTPRGAPSMNAARHQLLTFPCHWIQFNQFRRRSQRTHGK